MQDIAEKLKISVATVSRALRDIPGINSKTRASVLKAAAELGYDLPKKNGNTSSEVNRLQHIGVFMPTLHTAGVNLAHPYLSGLSEAALSLNSSLVIHQVNPGECEKLLETSFQPHALRSGLLSGIVLIFNWPTEVVRVLSQKLPVVSIMHKYPQSEADMVGIDNQAGMELMVKELHRNGHKRIAYIGRCGDLDWSKSRFGAYVASLSVLGLDYQPSWVVDVDSETIAIREVHWEAYEDRLDSLFKQGITGWVCATEPAGWMLHRWFKRRGLRVPEDVSITGFHRPKQPEGNPDLTSVSASYELLGVAALKCLLSRIQSPGEPARTILYPCEFYQGTTVGPAKV